MVIDVGVVFGFLCIFRERLSDVIGLVLFYIVVL